MRRFNTLPGDVEVRFRQAQSYCPTQCISVGFENTRLPRIVHINSAARSMMFGLVVAPSLVPPCFSADQTAEDPAAMAEQYTKQAVDFRAGAKKHAEMAKMYRSGLGGSSKTSHESIVQHCEKIASNLHAAATKSEALAAAYRKMAAEKPATR